MDLIRWRESYATGIDSMDLQHQKLIELINTLYGVIRKNEPSESIEDILNEMEKYAENHFRGEETLLMVNGYPDLSNHVDTHQKYLDKMKMLMSESKKGNETTAKDTYAFLRQWWMEHILNEDNKYGEFLASKGVK